MQKGDKGKIGLREWLVFGKPSQVLVRRWHNRACWLTRTMIHYAYHRRRGVGGGIDARMSYRVGDRNCLPSPWWCRARGPKIYFSRAVRPQRIHSGKRQGSNHADTRVLSLDANFTELNSLLIDVSFPMQLSTSGGKGIFYCPPSLRFLLYVSQINIEEDDFRDKTESENVFYVCLIYVPITVIYVKWCELLSRSEIIDLLQ